MNDLEERAQFLIGLIEDYHARPLPHKLERIKNGFIGEVQNAEANEREACAQLCEAYMLSRPASDWNEGRSAQAKTLANVIRDHPTPPPTGGRP